jgi:hypothetical protein
MGKKAIRLPAVLVLYCAGWVMISCSRELSLEARLQQLPPVVIDSLPLPDSLVTPVADTTEASCPGCKNIADQFQYYWSFRVGGKQICGEVKATYVNYERTGITFFGTATCTPDSGMVIDAFFEEGKLSASNQNFQAVRMNWQYADQVGNRGLLASWIPHPFSLVIQQYEYSTGIASGSFKGYAFNTRGDSTAIADGRFRIYIKP